MAGDLSVDKEAINNSKLTREFQKMFEDNTRLGQALQTAREKQRAEEQKKLEQEKKQWFKAELDNAIKEWKEANNNAEPSITDMHAIKEGVRDALEEEFENRGENDNKNGEVTTVDWKELFKDEAVILAETISKSILTVGKQLLGYVTQGAQEATDLYNSSFNQVSTLTGVSKSGWKANRSQIIYDLASQDLENNVSANEVMSAQIKLIEEGFTSVVNGMDARTLAEKNTVDNILNPYLDTTSKSWINLTTHNKINEDAVVGMPKYFQEMGLNTNVLKAVLNDLVSEMEPVSLWAEEELFGEKELAAVQSIVDAGYMTESEAKALVADASKVVTDSYGALTSGNVAQKVAVATGQYGDLDSAITSMLETATQVNTNDVLSQGSALSAWGLSGYFAQNADIDLVADTYEQNKAILEALEAQGYTAEEARKIAFGDLANDETTSEQDLIKYKFENSKWSEFESWIETTFPLASSALEIIWGGITSSVATAMASTDLMEKIGGKLFSKDGKLISSLGSFFGKDGTLSTAISSMSASMKSSLSGISGSLGSIASIVGIMSVAMAVNYGMRELYNKALNYLSDEGITNINGENVTLDVNEENDKINDVVTNGIKSGSWWETLNAFVTASNTDYGSLYYSKESSETEYAEGGYALSRANNITVGEAGKEVILPLEKNTEWAEILADKISNSAANQELIKTIKECCYAIVQELQNQNTNGGFINTNNDSLLFLKKQFT